MDFLTINNTNVTSYLDYQNGVFTKEPIYKSWTDANGVEHRDIIRTRITGTVTAGFRTAASLTSFTDMIDAINAGTGYASITAYIHNTGATETFNGYIETRGAAKWDITNGHEWHVIELTVTER